MQTLLAICPDDSTYSTNIKLPLKYGHPANLYCGQHFVHQRNTTLDKTHPINRSSLVFKKMATHFILQPTTMLKCIFCTYPNNKIEHAHIYTRG